MKQMFMLDIESTGVDKEKDDIIEIGVLEMRKPQAQGKWKPGKSLRMVLHTNKQPESAFAKEHMTALFAEANQREPMSVHNTRHRMLDFFKDCGCVGAKNVLFCGWNAGTFDVQFLVQKGYLVESGYTPDPGRPGKEIMTGDFHYRIYELSGAISLMSDILGFSPTLVRQMAQERAGKPLIDGRQHDALWDCHNQMNILNGLISLGRPS